MVPSSTVPYCINNSSSFGMERFVSITDSVMREESKSIGFAQYDSLFFKISVLFPKIDDCVRIPIGFFCFNLRFLEKNGNFSISSYDHFFFAFADFIS